MRFTNEGYDIEVSENLPLIFGDGAHGLMTAGLDRVYPRLKSTL
jgi:hypothetical protein